MIVLVSLLALGFAMTAQAGPRMYDGTLIIHAFANDTTGYSTLPFSTNIPALIPKGFHCDTRSYHAKSTPYIATYYNTNTSGNAGNGNYTSFTVPKYGGQTAVHHTNSESYPDGCGDASWVAGNPLTGKGSIYSTGIISTSRPDSSPRAFTLFASELSGSASGGSAAYANPYIFGKTYVQLKNKTGVFSENNGPGRYGPVDIYFAGGFQQGEGGLGVTPGDHAFGGTMTLLGTVYDIEGFQEGTGDTYIAKYTWLFQYVGGEAGTTGNSQISAPYIKDAHNWYIGRVYGWQDTSTVVAKALSWTTGTATATAVGGPVHTVMRRAGFDNRDPHGYGDIQMVSPMLTRWVYEGQTKSYYSAGVGIMQLRVAPEPHEWMLLGAGLSMLGLLYRANRRSR
jgi:hypothetical protein